MNEQLAKAIQQIEQGYHEEGLQAVESLIPKADDVTKRTIAELYFELGLVDQSLVLLEELMFQYPDHGELFAFAAECYSELGKEDEAIDMLSEVKKGDPAFIQSRLLLADLYEADGLEEVAEKKLLEALEEEPEDAVLQLGLGEFYLNRGEYQKAIYYFRQVILQKKLPEEFPVDPELRLAEAYSAIGEFENALEHYKLGLGEEEPPDALFGYGVTALQLDDTETARSAFERLLDADPDYTTAYPLLARSLIKDQLYDEAIAILDEGIKKDEFNEDLYLEMAKLQVSKGDLEEGKSFLQKVIALNPSNLSAVKELLLLLNEQEQFDAMHDLITFLDDYGEYDPLFERYRGKILLEEDDTQGAAEAYLQALDGLSEDEVIMEEALEAFLASGWRNQAVSLLKRLTQRQPDREDLVQQLERLTEEN